MRSLLALVMFVSSLLIAYGALMEFRYYGPGTTQFAAGLIATPAGLLGAAGAIVLATRGRNWFVVASAVSLLAGTIAATVLDVMGPPATILGLLGAIPPLTLAGGKLNTQ